MVDGFQHNALTTPDEVEALFAAMDDLVLIRDAAGCCQKVLTPHSGLLYQPADRLVGRTLHESLPPPVADRLLHSIRAALSQRQPVKCEYPLTIGDRDLWLDARLSPMSDGLVMTVIRDVTDRKHLEVQLTQSQTQLQNILDRTSAAIVSFEVDPATLQLQYHYYSAGCAQIYGFTATALMQDATLWQSRVHPADWQQVVLPAYAQLIADTYVRIEYRFHHSDQTWRWLAETATATWDQHRQRWSVITVAQDISDRKAIEQQLQSLNLDLNQQVAARTQALQQQEDQFRLFFDASPLPLSLADIPSRRFLRANVAYQEWLGYSPAELYTKTFLDLTHPDDVELDQRFSFAMESGQAQSLEFTKRFIKKSGEVVWANIQVALIRNAQGQPRYSLSVSQDVTAARQVLAARDQAETALRQQAKRDQLLCLLTQQIHQSLELDNILAIAVTEVRQTLHADRALVFQLQPDGSGIVLQEVVVAGYPQTQAGTWNDIKLSPECYRYFCEGVPRIIQNLTTDPCTLRPVTYLQNMGVQSKLIAPIIHIPEQGDSSLWGLLIVHACATHRQWQPDEADLLQQMANQLAIAIQQATLYRQVQSDLAERQQAEAHLRVALQEKNVLLKEVHHRVKNNLQIISSLLRMQSRLVEEPVIELFQEAQNRIHAIAVIHDHLYQSIDLSKINFEDYVKLLVSNLLRSYGVSSQSVQLHLEIQPLDLSLNAAIPCGLIINELISNALKYAFPISQQGEIKISLASVPAPLESSQNQVMLMIQDNGVGLPPDVDWQTSRTLGLRIVRMLVEQLGGTLALDRDCGTRFQITFPLSLPLT